MCVCVCVGGYLFTYQVNLISGDSWRRWGRGRDPGERAFVLPHSSVSGRGTSRGRKVLSTTGATVLTCGFLIEPGSDLPRYLPPTPLPHKSAPFPHLAPFCRLPQPAWVQTLGSLPLFNGEEMKWSRYKAF